MSAEWECNDPQHWYNPEAGWIECETCCAHAMDIVIEREKKQKAAESTVSEPESKRVQK